MEARGDNNKRPRPDIMSAFGSNAVGLKTGTYIPPGRSGLNQAPGFSEGAPAHMFQQPPMFNSIPGMVYGGDPGGTTEFDITGGYDTSRVVHVAPFVDSTGKSAQDSAGNYKGLMFKLNGGRIRGQMSTGYVIGTQDYHKALVTSWQNRVVHIQNGGTERDFRKTDSWSALLL